jgi:hypothetical protein
VDTNNSGDLNADIVVTSLKSRQRVYEGKGLQADVNIPQVELWNPRGYGEPNLHELEVYIRFLIKTIQGISFHYNENFKFLLKIDLVFEKKPQAVKIRQFAEYARKFCFQAELNPRRVSLWYKIPLHYDPPPPFSGL